MLENLRISDYYEPLDNWTSPARIYIMVDYSKKVMSADNQQERLDEQWIVGFVDGEGCFHIAISRLPKMTLGWQVLPEFRIVQHQRDVSLLKRIQNYFGYGSVGRNHGDRQEFRVRGMENLEKLVYFFKDNSLQSVKKHDFEIFCQVLEMMKRKEHLTSEGLNKIAGLASKMNRKVLRSLESSETIRQTPF